MRDTLLSASSSTHEIREGLPKKGRMVLGFTQSGETARERQRDGGRQGPVWAETADHDESGFFYLNVLGLKIRTLLLGNTRCEGAKGPMQKSLR